MVPQHLYERRFESEAKNLDTLEQKPGSVPTHINPNYQEENQRQNKIIHERILCRSNFELAANPAISHLNNFFWMEKIQK